MHEVLEPNIEQSLLNMWVLCCLFLDSHLTTHQSAVGVQFVYGNKLGWVALGTRKHYHDLLHSECSNATCGTHASDMW